jgi:cytoskeletal protein CcmA (bactofilin family)
MWKSDQPQKSPSDARQPPLQPQAPAVIPAQSPTVVASSSSLEPTAGTPTVAVSRPAGASLLMKGEISASEDLVLHGRIEGKVSLPGHRLIIGPQAEVSAEIVARTLIVNGSLTGNVAATERFEIRTGGRVKGNVVCPNVVMSEGSELTGGIDMRRSLGTTDEAPLDGEGRENLPPRNIPSVS